MHKETITFVDYNGEERTEDYYFNLSQAEVLKLEMLSKGGMDTYITKIINERDQKKITTLFCKIIKMSYGVKTLDGGFDKSKKHFKKFEQSEAYSQLFSKLAVDADFAGKFITGIMPQDNGPQDHKTKKLTAAEQAKQEAMNRLKVVDGSATPKE